MNMYRMNFSLIDMRLLYPGFLSLKIYIDTQKDKNKYKNIQYPVVCSNSYLTTVSDITLRRKVACPQECFPPGIRHYLWLFGKGIYKS